MVILMKDKLKIKEAGSLGGIRVNEAQRIILENVSVLPAEEIILDKAIDRVLAEDIYADIDVPLMDNSAMDGYAVRSQDTKGATAASPKILTVIEDVRAGYLAAKRIGENQAVRIMTGAVIPQGADSVVMVEDTKKIRNPQSAIRNESVEVCKEVRPGENVRSRGEDIKKGELVITRGTLLNCGHIGILAALGRATFRVTRKPRIAILATGDEVIDIKENLVPGKLRNTNSYTLASQIVKSGGLVEDLGISRDKPEELEEKLKKGLDCDLILTSGGVSVGDYDLVKFILAKMGTDIKFWKVAMKPGKPLVFGNIKGKLVFGLPGNPVSSMISFEVFVRETILKMLGQKSDNRKEVDAVLEEDLTKKIGLKYYIRAATRWEDGIYFTRSSGSQGSAILKTMALANSLIILAEDEELVRKGTRVRVRFLD